MATVKIKFRPSTSGGREGSIYYRVIHERTARQWSPGYKVMREEWDSKKCMPVVTVESARCSYLRALRERIRWDMERFKRIIAEFTSGACGFTADDVVGEFVSRQQQQSFFTFMEGVIVRLRSLGRQRTSETYITAFNSFRRFRNGEDVLFDGFDSELMECYEAYLSERGLIANSTSFHMRILRAVYNRAVEKEITDNRHPFRHVYTGVDKTKKRAIDINALKRIKDVDLSELPCADFARDMFMMSFYLRGMSFVDMAYLRKSDLANGQISYRRRKTGQQLMVKWRPEMQVLLDKYPPTKTEYLLPIITSSTSTPRNQYRSMQYRINSGLKTVAGHVGLDIPLTLYCSRHSWASIAKSKGIPVGVISDGLGHDSELTTQIYLSTLDTSAVDRANDLILMSL